MLCPKKTSRSHQVVQLHMNNWAPDGTCSNLNTITSVMREMIDIQMKSGNHPIVVHCRYLAKSQNHITGTLLVNPTPYGPVHAFIYLLLKQVFTQSSSYFKTIYIYKSQLHNLTNLCTIPLSLIISLQIYHCSDTVSRSGMFCAIATTIERCKTEAVVDVFQVVKALRVQKPGAIITAVWHLTK